MIALFLCACSFLEPEYFSEEKQNYRQYLEAKKLLDKQDYSAAIVELEDLWGKTHSRAILENLADTYRLNKQYEEGFNRISGYLEQHPGDFEIRLMRAKLLLGLERWEEAKGDLQIILFNKKISLWELVQDPDLKPYKNQPELEEILGFSTIQLRQLSQPDGGLVGDILLLDVQINHLRTCELSIKEETKTEQLQIQKLRLDSQKIDEWVVQTQLQINWLAVKEGTTSILQLPIYCDDEAIQLELQPMVIEKLVERKEKGLAPKPIVLLPSIKDCLPEGTKSSGETVSVQFRANGLLEKECLIANGRE